MAAMKPPWPANLTITEHPAQRGASRVRILILGHYKLERLLGPLVARGATEIVLWSEVNPGLAVPGASFQWIQMNRLASSEVILDLLDSVRPDTVVANVLGEEEEHLILPYAVAAERRSWQDRFLWHPSVFARPAADKASLHRVAMSLGLPVPGGGIARNLADVRSIVGDLGGTPVVLKEIRAQALQGVHAAPDNASLNTILAMGSLKFPLLVQEMVTGEEIGIEILSSGRTSCRFPVASIGDMDPRCCPVARVRSMPRALPRPALSMVEQIVETIEDRLAPRGPWQLDLALTDRKVIILEINGRLGGLSDMGLDVTGLDPHDLFCGLAMGERLPDPAPAAIAMEIPVIPGAPLPPAGDEIQISCHTFPDFPDTDYWRLSLRSADGAAVEQWADRVDPASLWTSHAALRTQVRRAVDGLESASAGRQTALTADCTVCAG